MGTGASQKEVQEEEAGVAIAKRGCSLSFLSIGSNDDDIAPVVKSRRNWRSKGQAVTPSSTPSVSPVGSPRLKTIPEVAKRPVESQKTDLEAPLLPPVPEYASGGLDIPSLIRWIIGSCSIVMTLVCASAPSVAAHSANRTLQLISEELAHGPGSRIDYTIRLTGDPSYCITSVGTEVGSLVQVSRCDSVHEELKQFTLAHDGVIHLMADPSVCLAALDSHEFGLEECSGYPEQVWNYRIGGEFELQAQPNMCLNVMNSDYVTGKLGLYQCEGSFADMFAYGGGHFLTPGLAQEFKTISDFLDAGRACYLWEVACVFMLSLMACVSLAAAAYYFGNLSESTIQLSLACIITLLAGQCLMLLFIAPVYGEVLESANVKSVTELDFTLRLSSFPNHCVTSQTVSPFVLSVSNCGIGDRAQQFVFEDIDKGIRLHPRWKLDMCMTMQSESARTGVVLRRCADNLAYRQLFTNPQGTGGSLPLINTSSCVNLLNGDVDSGMLGFFQCSGDLNQIFVYSQGNPTVARLLQQLRLLFRVAIESMQSPYLLFFRYLVLYLILGVFVPALWCFLKFYQAAFVSASAG